MQTDDYSKDLQLVQEHEPNNPTTSNTVQYKSYQSPLAEPREDQSTATSSYCQPLERDQ